jgi:chromosome segregation ATPase
MNFQNKENLSNNLGTVTVTLSRRAKNDNKRLTLSPLHDSRDEEIVGEVDEDKLLMAQRQERDRLQHKIKELESKNNSLSAQLAVSKVTSEQIERKMNERISALEHTLKRVREEAQQKYDSEHERVRSLKKENTALKRDGEAKALKIARLEEYLAVSKEIANNLQNEKKQLEVQVHSAKEVIKRLEDLTERTRLELETSATKNRLCGECQTLKETTTTLETQIALLNDRLTSLTKDLEVTGANLALTEQLLFHTLALSIKLNHHLMDKPYNCSILELYEECKAQNVPRSEWGKFIEDTLARAYVPSPVPQSRTSSPPLSKRNNLKSKRSLN